MATYTPQNQLLSRLEYKNKLPPGILSAVMQIESGGNINAVSPKGARGLMQFMPATAEQYGVNVNDPVSSLSGAAQMLGELHQKYNGDIDKTVAAYNWGQGNVDRKGIENAPAETRSYMDKILSAINPIGEASASETPYQKPIMSRAEFKAMQQGNEQTPKAVISRAEFKAMQQSQTPSLIAQLEGMDSPKKKKVTDPALIAQLESEEQQVQPFEYEGRPVKSMSGPSQFLAGVGNTVMDIGRGAVQIYGNPAPNEFGGVEDVAQSKALREELNKSGAGMAGNIVGAVAPAVMTGGTSLPAVMASGAAYGALQPTEGGDNKLTRAANIATGAVSGAAGVGVGKIIEKTPNALAWMVGNLGTHTGGESLKQAAKAGAAGGKKAESFLENMRNSDANYAGIVDDMKGALGNMRQQMGDAYRQGMTSVKADRTILDFQPIKKAVDDSFSIGVSSGGHVMNPSAANVQKEIAKQVKIWEKGNPMLDHTAQGMDELKRTVGNIRDKTDFGTPERVVADRAYNSIKDQIIKQAPQYKDVMTKYEKDIGQIDEITRTLSLGDKAAKDTAMRKALSLTRNNANTNYGNRLKLAQELEQSGAPNLMSDLSGQALNTWTPRGLGGMIASGTAGYGLASMNPAIAPLLAMQSPRLMGEAAYYAGKLGSRTGTNKLMSGLINNAGNIGVGINNYLGQ